MTSAPEDPRLKRLRFRAWHRGFVEADLILGPFADRHGAALTETELDDLERLMEQADQDIYAWINGQEPPPAGFDTPVLARIQAFRLVAHARPDAGDPS